MTRRPHLLPFGNRITTSDAPRFSGNVEVKVIDPTAMCCRCCDSQPEGCATPDAHTTECDLMAHQNRPGWRLG